MWSGAWPNLQIQNYALALERHSRLVREPTAGQSDEVTAALARFLVVRSAGYIEIVSEECISAYADSKTPPNIARYARSWLGRGRNPSPGLLADLVGRFDNNWRLDLENLFNEEDEYIKRELALMVDRRNKIAHGAGEGINSRKALEFVEVARLVAQWFIERFDPR